MDMITHLYLSYPSINTVLYTIEQWNLNGSIVNDTFSSYVLRLSTNSIELLLEKSILHDREDHLIIRLWNETTLFSDIKLRLIYHQSTIHYPTILSQTIEGYLNVDHISSNINLGQLLLHNHSQYQFVYFHLQANNYFSLEQVSNNRTDVYYHSSSRSAFGQFQIIVTAVGLIESISAIDFPKDTKIFFPSEITSQSITIHLHSIDSEMLDRTVSLVLPFHPIDEQFLLDDFLVLRQTLARMLGVEIDDIHLYTFEFQERQFELFFAASNSTSRHYLPKEFLYNALKNTNNTSDHCLFNTCEMKIYCPRFVHLLTNQYSYFYWNTHQRVLPKYQWEKNLANCDYLQETSSPCSSNPCLPTEQCLEKNATSYSCQCIDVSCHREKSLNCINIHSPTCRGESFN